MAFKRKAQSKALYLCFAMDIEYMFGVNLGC